MHVYFNMFSWHVSSWDGTVQRLACHWQVWQAWVLQLLRCNFLWPGWLVISSHLLHFPLRTNQCCSTCRVWLVEDSHAWTFWWLADYWGDWEWSSKMPWSWALGGVGVLVIFSFEDSSSRKGDKQPRSVDIRHITCRPGVLSLEFQLAPWSWALNVKATKANWGE